MNKRFLLLLTFLYLFVALSGCAETSDSVPSLTSTTTKEIVTTITTTTTAASSTTKAPITTILVPTPTNTSPTSTTRYFPGGDEVVYIDVDKQEFHTDTGIAMTIDKTSYAVDGKIVAHIVNNSDHVIEFGPAFHIWEKTEDGWTFVRNMGTQQILLTLGYAAGGTNWEMDRQVLLHHYDVHSSGVYKLVLEIEGKLVSADFSVE